MYDRSDQVRVRNGTDRLIKGRFAGVDYVWKPGQHLDIPLVVAHHVFGFGGDDKSKDNALVRLGWMRTTDETESAYDRLSKVSFSDCPELIERDSISTGVRPLDEAGGDDRRTLTRPPVDSSEAEGETL